ncbi:MAG: response regulator [Candidatus Hodarchaeales archaeon]|jgi:DNA-binding response OmpR family regulator
MESTKKKWKATKSKAPRILVIDDERDAVELLELILSQEGYIVDKSFTAKEATEILESYQKLPDLILLDVKMPGKNGIKLCQELKRDEKFKSIPIIILSALIFPKDVEKGLECGAIDYISKPWSNDDLISRINNQLN